MSALLGLLAGLILGAMFALGMLAATRCCRQFWADRGWCPTCERFSEEEIARIRARVWLDSDGADS